MMGRKKQDQAKLFYEFRLEDPLAADAVASGIGSKKKQTKRLFCEGGSGVAQTQVN